MIENFKPTNALINKVLYYAPHSYSNEPGYERRLGIYSDDAENENKGFKNICIHIKAGMSGLEELYLEVLKMINKIQYYLNNYYSIFIFCFASSNEELNQLKYFKCTNNDSTLYKKRSKEIEEFVSRQIVVTPALINRLAPLGSERNIYGKSIGFEKEDLLIIIGDSNEFYINDRFSNKFSSRSKKRAIYVEISEDKINWFMGENFNPIFI